MGDDEAPTKMSDGSGALSASEKRRLARERRKKKLLAQGEDRLHALKSGSALPKAEEPTVEPATMHAERQTASARSLHDNSSDSGAGNDSRQKQPAEGQGQVHKEGEESGPARTSVEGSDSAARQDGLRRRAVDSGDKESTGSQSNSSPVKSSQDGHGEHEENPVGEDGQDTLGTPATLREALGLQSSKDKPNNTVISWHNLAITLLFAVLYTVFDFMEIAFNRLTGELAVAVAFYMYLVVTAAKVPTMSDRQDLLRMVPVFILACTLLHASTSLL